MKRFAIAITLLASTLGFGLAAPASAGGTSITVNPTSGSIGATVEVTAFCGYNAPYEIYFFNDTQAAGTLVAEDDSGSSPGPYVHDVEIPAVLTEGLGAPEDVQPGNYQFGIICENGETSAEVDFQVTQAPTTTTAPTTTLEPTTSTTTQAVAAQAIALQPAFTG